MDKQHKDKLKEARKKINDCENSANYKTYEHVENIAPEIDKVNKRFKFLKIFIVAIILSTTIVLCIL
jgi:hypothetical protein